MRPCELHDGATFRYVVAPWKHVVALLLLCFFWVATAHAAPEDIEPWPKDNEVAGVLRQALKKGETADERVAIRSMHAMEVGKNEPAFLVTVWLADRGRNFSSGTFLYRPRLKQARELKFGQSLGSLYVPRRGHLFVQLQNYASGQGEEEMETVVAKFDGWQPIVLYRARFGNNLGICGVSIGLRCEEKWIDIRMLGGEKDVLMLEITSSRNGAEIELKKPSISSRLLRLVGNKFVPTGN